MNKKYLRKIKTPNILTVIILVLLLLFVCLVGFYKNADLFVFPFKAQVWGTVSDWIIVLITAISAIYIANTLNEQKNINKASLLPIFKIEEQPKINTEAGYPVMKIKLVKNSAYYFATSKIYGEFINADAFPLLFYIAEGETFEIKCTPNLPPGETPIIVTRMTFSFRDVSNNLYWQDITYDRWRELHTLSIPRLEI